MLFFWTFYLSKNPEKNMYQGFHKNIKQYNCFQHWWQNNCFLHQISILEWILKDRVTLKNAEEFNFTITGINYILNYKTDFKILIIFQNNTVFL